MLKQLSSVSFLGISLSNMMFIATGLMLIIALLLFIFAPKKGKRKKKKNKTESDSCHEFVQRPLCFPHK